MKTVLARAAVVGAIAVMLATVPVSASATPTSSHDAGAQLTALASRLQSQLKNATPGALSKLEAALASATSGLDQPSRTRVEQLGSALTSGNQVVTSHGSDWLSQLQSAVAGACSAPTAGTSTTGQAGLASASSCGSLASALQTAISHGSTAKSTPNLIGSLVGALVNVLGTVPSAVGLVSDTLCPATTALANATSVVPVLGTLTGGLNTLVCDLALLDFTFRTTVNTAGGGTIVRNNSALLDVPALLFVGNNVAPQLVGTVTAVSLSKATLTINKLAVAPKTLPVQTELILRNPANIHSSDRISVGYDGRPSTAPDKFKATLGILSTSSPVHLTVSLDQTGAGDGAALVAGMTSPGNSTSAHIAFTPFPATIGADVTLGASQDIKLTSSVPTTAVAHVDLTSGNSEQVIDGTIDQLPTAAEVNISSAGANQRQVTYSANAAINKLHVTYKSLTNSGGGSHLDQEADATVTGVPTGLTFSQTGAKSASLTTSGGPIGEIDGGFAENGAPVPVAGTESGAHVVLQAPLTSVAMRIRGVTSATIDASKPYTADLQSTTQPMDILVEDHDGGRTIEAQVNNLPAHLSLKVDPDHGLVVSNGFGEPINEIKVHATSTTPWFSRATRIDGDVTGVPAEMTLSYGTSSTGTFSVGSDNPIGNINLLASDGSDQSLPDANSGVMYTDIGGGKFAITARLSGLKSISANPSPIAFAVTTSSPQVFEIHAHKDYLVADGTIDELPSSLCFQQFPANSSTPNQFVYSANAAINHLHLRASNLPLPGQATTLLADVTSLPKSIVVTMPSSGPVFSATATDGSGNPDGSANCTTPQTGNPTAIGNLMVHMADKASDFVQFRKQAGDFPFPPANPNAGYSTTADGITMRDIKRQFDSNYAIGIQIHGLRSASIETSPAVDIKADVDPSLARAFGISVQSQHDPGGNDFTYYEGWLSKLVSNMELFKPAPPDEPPPNSNEPAIPNPTEFSYSGDAPISTLDLRSNLGGVQYLRTTISNLPRKLDVCFGTGIDGMGCMQDPLEAFTPNLAVQLNDEGTSAADHITPTINGVLCLDRNHPDQCPGTEPTNSDQSHKFIAISSLQIRRLELALQASICGGLLFCGHAEANTDGQNAAGTVSYFDSDIAHIASTDYALHAGITLPPGFSAIDRQTAWEDHPLTPPYYPGDHSGTINCPRGTSIGAFVTDSITGSPLISENVAGVLCANGL